MNRHPISLPVPLSCDQRGEHRAVQLPPSRPTASVPEASPGDPNEAAEPRETKPAVRRSSPPVAPRRTVASPLEATTIVPRRRAQRRPVVPEPLDDDDPTVQVRRITARMRLLREMAGLVRRCALGVLERPWRALAVAPATAFALVWMFGTLASTSHESPALASTRHANPQPSASSSTATLEVRTGPTVLSLDDLEEVSPGRGVSHPEPKSVAEVFRSATERLERERAEARRWGATIVKKPPSDITAREVERLVSLAADPRTFREGFGVLAEIDHALGPDLIYRVVRDHESADAIADLGTRLLQTAEIRARASLALGVAIDAFELGTCEEARALLERAQLHGDQRAVPHLASLAERTGCGDDQAGDCFPCLRRDRLLVDTLRTVSGRHSAL